MTKYEVTIDAELGVGETREPFTLASKSPLKVHELARFLCAGVVSRVGADLEPARAAVAFTSTEKGKLSGRLYDGDTRAIARWRELSDK